MPLVSGDGNRFLTDDIIAKTTLVQFKNNLVGARLVFRDLEKRFGEIGDTISIRLPNQVIVNDGRTATKTTPIADQYATLQISNQKNVKFNWTQKDKELSLIEFTQRYLKPAGHRLANEVDISIFNQYKYISNFFGSPGNALTIANIVEGKAYLEMLGVEDDGLSNVVVSPLETPDLIDEIKNLYQPKMVEGAVRKGFIGEIDGYEIYSSPNLPTHTVGNYSGNETAGSDLHYGNQIVLTAGTFNADSFNVGDIITFAGVYEINLVTKQRTGRLKYFTVTGWDGTTGTLTFSPTLNDGTGTTTDGNGNTVSLEAEQNVDGYIVSGAAVNVMGNANTTYRQALILHKYSIALAVISMKLPPEAHGYIIRDGKSGLSLALSHYWNGDDYEDNTRLDVLYGVSAVRPELSARAYTEVV